MAGQLRQCLILVRNVAKTLDFFGQDGIGLKILLKTESYGELEAGESLTLAIKKATRESELCKGYSPFLCFDVHDVDMLIPKLVLKGAVLDGGVKHEPEGKFAALRSPDGVTIGLREVLYNPSQLQMMRDADSTMNRGEKT